MDFLATLFLTLHIANPFAVKTMPNFYVAPVAAPVAVRVYVSPTETMSHSMSPQPEPYYPKAVSTPTGCPYGDQIPVDSPKCAPPQGWDATNAPGMGVTCWSTTQCLNQKFGDGGDGGQPGYVGTCPDGTPAQGSCSTPEGPK